MTSGRSSYAGAIGAPRPAATTATPPMASTIRIAKNHIIGVGRPFSRAATISATASSTSSVSVQHVEVGLR